MAKATLTFEDTEDGHITARIEFDPPAEERDDGDGGWHSEAQMGALIALRLWVKAATRQAVVSEEDD